MGRVVVLEHDYGLCSYYMNLADNLPDGLEVGKEVQAGDEIGYVGTTAVLECGDGPHLHFELTVNDELIDAYKEIKGRQRLKDDRKMRSANAAATKRKPGEP